MFIKFNRTFLCCRIFFYKGEALENIVDSNGHVMLAGEQFLEVHYLEKNKEGKKHIHYKSAKQGTSFIHPQEVLSCFVQIDEELRMELCEYQYLMMAACECKMQNLYYSTMENNPLFQVTYFKCGYSFFDIPFLNVTIFIPYFFLSEVNVTCIM